MESLAEGGYQVGALAQQYYPHGVMVEEKSPEIALAKTQELLSRPGDVVIFEAAFASGNYLIRADIFMRFGGKYFMKEVKAKSWDATFDGDDFVGKRGDILSQWAPFLQDLAFQRFVAEQALGDSVQAGFMFVDKNAVAHCDGIFQSFRVTRKNGRKHVEVQADLPEEFLHSRLLIDVDATDALNLVVAGGVDGMAWEYYVEHCAYIYLHDQWMPSPLGSKCGSCEFAPSGFKKCWEAKGVDLERPLTLDVRQWRSKDKFIQSGVYYMDMLDPGDFGKSDLGDRQRLQLKDEIYFDVEGYQNDASQFKYPLNFIDFETCSPALPLYAGFRPYQAVAFQFSHHILHEDGRLEHREFLHKEHTPASYHFLRALKESLSDNDGTVFRWHNHENTILNFIIQNLQNDENPPDDAVELIAFAASLTKGGTRAMVDQYALATKRWYHPDMRGSWSIKKVLKTIMPQGYGDPYKMLPAIHVNGLDLDDECISDLSELHDGGAAMIAWLTTQSKAMGEAERVNIHNALLRYCELDTMAMVWFHQHMSKIPLTL